MGRESTQHKLDRVRSPRVQITYDVEIGGAIELKELPFVVGVLGDLTGQPEKPLPRLKDRKFGRIFGQSRNHGAHSAPEANSAKTMDENLYCIFSLEK